VAVAFNTVQVPPGIPDGATVGLYRLIEVEHDRSRGNRPGATPLDTATVSVAGEVTFSVPGRGVLEQGEYAIHATVSGQERWGVFMRGKPRKESEANQKRKEARRKRNRRG
jgi:hypothetical protein